MRDDSMFGTLESYEEPAYWTAHPTLYLLTPEADYECGSWLGVMCRWMMRYMRQTGRRKLLREYLHEAMGIPAWMLA